LGLEKFLKRKAFFMGEGRFAINTCRPFTSVIAELLDVSPAFLQLWISVSVSGVTALSACRQLELLYTTFFVGGIDSGGISSRVSLSKIHQ
jgi:hypothetical protein